MLLKPVRRPDELRAFLPIPTATVDVMLRRLQKKIWVGYFSSLSKKETGRDGRQPADVRENTSGLVLL